MTTDTLRHAGRLWDYLSSPRSRAPCDVVAVLCSYDLRVCDHACALVQQGLAERLLLSGRSGNWTRHLWDRPEAQVFLERAVAGGVPEWAITLEEQATNFGENVAFTRQKLPGARSVTFVTKPNSILRVGLTVPVRWPGLAAWIDCPDIEFPGGVSNVVGILGVIDEMVGDIHRIIEYPRRGFQVSHELPEEVLESWRYLIGQGFRGHLLPGPAPDLSAGDRASVAVLDQSGVVVRRRPD
jgi:hypothetical protein